MESAEKENVGPEKQAQSNIIQRIIGLILKPEQTMKEIVADPRIEESIIIVAAFTIVALVASYVSSQHMSQGSSLNVMSLIIGIIWPFISWFIATGVLYGLTVFFGGEGKFSPDLLNAIGYTYIAKVPFAIISMILLLLTPVIVIPSISQTAPTADELRHLADVLSSYMFNPFYLLSFIAGIIGLFWSCYLGMLAVKEAMKVRMKTAVIMVGVPMVIYIAIATALTFGSILLIQWAANALA